MVAPQDENTRLWHTVGDTRRVLFIVHTVASANRLLDLVWLFESDFRVQVAFTCPSDASLSAGVDDFFDETGFPSIKWADAITVPWDLAITANTSGNLTDMRSPIVVVSHGIGYSKTITRKPGNPETRKPGNPETRKPGNPETRFTVCPRSRWFAPAG